MKDNPFSDNKYKELISKLKFYDKEYPTKDEFVLAKIINYEEQGICCYLNEYKAEAMLSFKDASSSKRLKNIKKQVKKGKSYILSVLLVDENKGFIDVEKRNIENKDEVEYEELIQFYERVFNIFVKAYYINNPNCDVNDVKCFLKNTIWRQDPKEIKNNLKNIHVEPEKVKKLYNIDYIESNIFTDLLTNIKKPSYKHAIFIEVKCIDLEACTIIKEFFDKLGNHLDIEFKTHNVPVYYSKIKTEYNPNFDPEGFKNKLTHDAEEFIKSYNNENLFANVKEVLYRLV